MEIRMPREEAPNREIRQQPAGVETRAQPEMRPGAQLHETLPPLALVLHLEEDICKLQGPNQMGSPANILRS